MNSIICQRLKVVHRDDIEKMYPGTIKLKNGKSFMNIPLEESATYQSSSKNESGGMVITETVTATTKYDEKLFLIRFPLQYYVLMLYTNKGSFIVGSPEYPAELTHSNDKIFVNLTFKAVSPA